MDEIDNAKRLNRQLAAKCLVRVQDAEARIAKEGSSEALETELAAARYDYEAAMKELKELDRLAGQAQVLEAKALVTDDPLIRSPEQVALDNVRDHIANLGAQVKLGEDMAPAPEPTAPAEDPEEAARKQFEALRSAKPKKTL